jgi:hypothetical protein
MSIVRCPRCRDEVMVPARATGRALVRCPLCLEQYLLAEALAGAPPLLVIIGGEVEQAAIDDSGEPGIDYQVASGGFASAALDASAPVAASVTVPRSALRTGQRPRRKEQSGLSFLISVVGGGVVAAPLTLLVLWWCFQWDELELGPTVAQYAPWIVPSQFHGRPVGNVKHRDGNATAAATPSKDAQADLQTPPGLDEPEKLPADSLTPPIDAPNLKDGDADDAQKREPAPVKPASATRELPTTQTPSSPPPMPDLTDLLPSGPTR